MVSLGFWKRNCKAGPMPSSWRLQLPSLFNCLSLCCRKGGQPRKGHEKMHKREVLSLAQGMIRGQRPARDFLCKNWIMQRGAGRDPMNDSTGFQGVEGASCTRGCRASGKEWLVVWPPRDGTRTAR